MKISICIIVKNEEKYLGRLLDSIRSQCDDIIILDTGSTDKTIEIAQKFNTNIQYFTWNNSFADARNAASTYAKNDWIMWLDADMWLSHGTLMDVENLINKLPEQIDSIGFKIIDNHYTFHSPRVYKKGLQFIGSVHEDCQPKQSIATPFIIYHQRDETPEEKQTKAVAYEKMLLAEYKIDNKSLHALLYLRDMAMSRKDYIKTKIYCRQFLKIKNDYMCHYYLAIINYEDKNFKTALDCGFDALKENCKDPRVYIIIANIYDELDSKIDALTFYNLAMSLLPESKLIGTRYAVQEDDYNVIPLWNMAKIYLDIGNKEKAIQCYQQALQINPNTIHRISIEQNISKLIEGTE